MDELGEWLKVDGYDVVDTELIPMAYNLDLAKKSQIGSNILVLLDYVSSVETFRRLYPSKRLVDTL